MDFVPSPLDWWPGIAFQLLVVAVVILFVVPRYAPLRWLAWSFSSR